MDADANQILAHLPKDEAETPERAPENFQPDLSEMSMSSGTLTDTRHRFRSRHTPRMRSVSAPHEPTEEVTRRRTNRRAVPPKPMNHGCEQHNCRMLFCRLTPELSRPTAGRQQRSTPFTPRCGVGLNDLLGGNPTKIKLRKAAKWGAPVATVTVDVDQCLRYVPELWRGHALL